MTTFGGSITGEGADWILLDDPMSASHAMSETERARVIEIYSQTIASRLNSKSGRMVLAMQRLHVNDLAGHLLSMGGWDVLRIPAIAEEDTVYDIGDGVTYTRKKGSLIDPRRFDGAELERRRLELGTAGFGAQYQQAPHLPDGVIFKRQWLHMVDELPVFERVFVSVDIAGSAHRGDYTVFLVWDLGMEYSI